MSLPIALITINGDSPRLKLPPKEIDFLKSLAAKADYKLAADGGCLLYLKAGIKPDVLIGDLDSLSKAAIAKIKKMGVKIVSFPPEKDFSDLHLALEEAIKLRAGKIWLYGGSPENTSRFRPDHFLVNIALLRRGKEQGLEMCWFLNPETRLLLAKEKEIVTAPAGSIVSLIPLTQKVENIALKGFVYPLQQETLELADSRGLSNLLKADQGIITKGRGELLICINQKTI